MTILACHPVSAGSKWICFAGRFQEIFHSLQDPESFDWLIRISDIRLPVCILLFILPQQLPRVLFIALLSDHNSLLQPFTPSPSTLFSSYPITTFVCISQPFLSPTHQLLTSSYLAIRPSTHSLLHLDLQHFQSISTSSLSRRLCHCLNHTFHLTTSPQRTIINMVANVSLPHNNPSDHLLHSQPHHITLGPAFRTTSRTIDNPSPIISSPP